MTQSVHSACTQSVLASTQQLSFLPFPSLLPLPALLILPPLPALPPPPL